MLLNFTASIWFTYLIYIVIALDEMHSSAALSVLVLFFVKSQLVGVGESDKRDQSAPA